MGPRQDRRGPVVAVGMGWGGGRVQVDLTLIGFLCMHRGGRRPGVLEEGPAGPRLSTQVGQGTGLPGAPPAAPGMLY